MSKNPFSTLFVPPCCFVVYAWYFIFVEYFLEIMTRRVQWWMGILTKPVPSKGTQGTTKIYAFSPYFCNLLYQWNILFIEGGNIEGQRGQLNALKWFSSKLFRFWCAICYIYFQQTPHKAYSASKKYSLKRQKRRQKEIKQEKAKGVKDPDL